MQLYRLGKFLFSINGYSDIGMDHFALKNDELFKAREEGRLHRNFMGYTTQATQILIGLGVSSISDTGNGYAQNAKALHEYYAQIHAGELAVQKGCLLTEEDQRFKQYILDISCKGGTLFDPQDRTMLERYSLPVLRQLEADGLVELSPASVTVTTIGHHFIRNICSAFDLYLQQDREATELNNRPIYSKAI
jgi:oxygen-independent coproporphyrinogen-3 oxidase